MMELYRPRSFLKLVLIGFSFVALPLIIGLISAAARVGTLSNQSRHALHRAVQATRSSWLLFDETIDLERSAAQYAVLRDPQLLRNYEAARAQFAATEHRLSRLPLTQRQRARLDQLMREERTAFRRLLVPGASPGRSTTLVRFNNLTELARELVINSNELVNSEAETVRRSAQSTRRILLLQALALIPATLFLSGLFAILIVRPIVQIEQSIRLLGDGRFEEPIHVQGTRDLEYLGQRLDWLRIRLAELDQEKQRFLHHVSHELKTPLCAIREGSELLLEEVVGRLNAKQHEIAMIVKNNCLRLQKLIEDLIAFSTACANSLHLAPVALDALIAQVLEDHTPSVIKKRVTLSRDCAPLTLTADNTKLAAVIDNLVANAVQHVPVGGTIAVQLRAVDGAAVLEVMDNGPGIPWDERGRVFEAFFQGKAAGRRAVHGTGLGLSIAKEYVTAHQGSIEIVDGPGSHFRVRLPGATDPLQHAC